MTVFQGKGVCNAIAIGKISIIQKQDVSVKRYHVDDTEAEKARVNAAKRPQHSNCRRSMKRH